jgi:hypothetical protein
MKWKRSALFDFFAEDVADAGTIKGYFVLAVAGLPRGSRVIASLRQSTRGFVHVDHEGWSVSSGTC